MSIITIYSKDHCPHCVSAKTLLGQKGRSDYTEIDIGQDRQKAMEMVKLSGGRRTVPQIFIDDKHIGGFDDLKAFDDAGKLAELL